MPWHECSGTDWRWSWRCSPADWHLETDPADQRAAGGLALAGAALRRFDPATTFPEVLNEPVFAGDPAAWARLQHQAVLAIRAVLPANTIVLTGADWGGIAGLLSLPPEPDPNVVYSFHLYEPAELTALGAYRPGLDAAAMARLPFPVTDAGRLRGRRRHERAIQPTADLMRFYCAPALGRAEGRRTDRPRPEHGAGGITLLCWRASSVPRSG